MGTSIEKLPGDYIAGFVDGEGCFALKLIRAIRHDRKDKPEYLYWAVEFVIVLRGDDRDILEAIQLTLGCGRISQNKYGHVRYAVNHLGDLQGKILPFFEKQPLRAKKRKDFKLWHEAVMIINRNQQDKRKRIAGHRGFLKTIWPKEDSERLIHIHEDMKQYKSRGKEWKWLNNAK